MYYALFVLMGAINLGALLVMGKYSLYSCMLLCMMNAFVFPILSYFLTSLTAFSSPMLKGLGYYNHTEKSPAEYVAYETGRLMKQPFFYILLIAPYLIGLCLNDDLLNELTLQNALLIATIFLSAIYLLILMAITRNFSSQHNWIPMQIPMLLFVSYMLFAPHTETNLLILGLATLACTLVLMLCFVSYRNKDKGKQMRTI